MSSVPSAIAVAERVARPSRERGRLTFGFGAGGYAVGAQQAPDTGGPVVAGQGEDQSGSGQDADKRRCVIHEMDPGCFT